MRTEHPDALAPVRLMCCICYGRYETDELHVDAAGVTWDMCAGCGKDVAG